MGVRVFSIIFAYFGLAIGVVREDFEEEFVWEDREPTGVLTF